MTLLEAESVVSGYGDVEILHGVSIEVAADEIVTIVGPNGAGKSTLMRAIFGILPLWGGEVFFEGEAIGGMEPHGIARIGMAYIPQTENVFPSLTVQENLRMGGHVLDEIPDGAYEAIYETFPILKERADQKAGTLSGGQRQMLAMARALITNPQLILIDEPSAGLAPHLVDDVFEKIVEINQEGMAVLMVEQNARAALRRSHRGYVLDMGENRFEGGSDDLIDNDEVVNLYLGG